ncbi:hypothetical protein GE09DRAFT_268822 [Coniochaeta sp. 2T2.1]|nr:hypothetical protein GE09DRAFT_268822 [Coniochaeta sp. 2T2.1]
MRTEVPITSRSKGLLGRRRSHHGTTALQSHAPIRLSALLLMRAVVSSASLQQVIFSSLVHESHMTGCVSGEQKRRSRDIEYRRHVFFTRRATSKPHRQCVSESNFASKQAGDGRCMHCYLASLPRDHHGCKATISQTATRDAAATRQPRAWTYR